MTAAADRIEQLERELNDFQERQNGVEFALTEAQKWNEEIKSMPPVPTEAMIIAGEDYSLGFVPHSTGLSLQIPTGLILFEQNSKFQLKIN